MLLIVHGGAGNRKPSQKALKILSESLAAGYEVLKLGGSAMDAVVMAITTLENSGIFNAGLGGNLQFDGVRRLDASLMEGKDLKAGAVIGLERIRNPILGARIVMDTPHVMFTNRGARTLMKGLAPLPKPDKKALNKLGRTKKRAKRVLTLYNRYFSTVGAVAMDAHGDVAAGSSTGGTSAMLPGRVGDTPVIGAGAYADNSSGAVSCTGKGESIIRRALAKEICMNLDILPPFRAARVSLKRILSISGEAGVIAINRRGKFVIAHTTRYMASGYVRKNKQLIREKFMRVEK